MKIIIIIGSVIIAAISGYLVRLAIDQLIKEQIIMNKDNPLSLIPDTIKYIFTTAVFLFVMAIAILVISLKEPY